MRGSYGRTDNPGACRSRDHGRFWCLSLTNHSGDTKYDEEEQSMSTETMAPTGGEA